MQMSHSASTSHPGASMTQAADAGAAYRAQRSASVASRTSLIGDWEIDPDEQKRYETIFYGLKPVNGKLTGEQCRPVLLNSRLPQLQLAQIWEFADVDRDGQLDKYEMCIALHLVYRCLHGESLPDTLPISFIHPMKRVQCGITAAAGDVNSSLAVGATPLSRRSSNASIPSKFSQASLTRSISGVAQSGGGLFDSKHADASAPWPVNVGIYEPLFQRLDTDADGLVGGADVKIHALGFGLPQTALAHIWALVDVERAGCLNLEQFALWNELMKECQLGRQLPERLPPHLLPPSMRARMTISRVSSSGNSISSGGTTAAAALADNPRILELNGEIEKAMENRRKAEQDLFQLEADTLVKNSELKNLELELQTLSTTVRQLQNQRSEAERRLGELDARADRLEATCVEHATRLADEEARLQRVKTDIAQAHDNFNAEEEILKNLRAEAATAEAKRAESASALASEQRRIEILVDELTTLERQSDSCTRETTNAERASAELAALLTRLRAASDKNREEQMDEKNENRDEQMKSDDSPTSEKKADSDDRWDEEVLAHTFQRFALDDNGLPFSAATKPILSTFATDPFKDDPFAGSDTALVGDPFNGNAIDATLAAPEDPFGASAPLASGEQFADFSKFSAFDS